MRRQVLTARGVLPGVILFVWKLIVLRRVMQSFVLRF